MRVTAATKEATRQQILAAARKLFASEGFDATTTRDISHAAGVAAGTLFNYFPTKEAIVGCLACEALGKAQEEFERKPDETGSLEEALFAHIALGLRTLKPIRAFLAATLDVVFCPTARAAATEYAEVIRTAHLENVSQLVSRHGWSDALSANALQLYWTLYTGLVGFWTTDRSPKQEDTLALLDESMNMFVNWLTN